VWTLTIWWRPNDNETCGQLRVYIKLHLHLYILFMARQPYMGLGLLVSSRFHGHTHLRHTTVGRTPLDGGPARRRELYLTTHNTHNRQTLIYIFFLWLDSPIWAWASSFRRGFLITHIWDTPQSVGLLWTGDQLVAVTSTWQHTTLTTDRHPCPRWEFFFFLPVRGFFPLIHFCTV
jgi:hypothetical protein